MKASIAQVFGIMICLLVVSACGPRVTRMDPNQDANLSGKWNDDDYRRVAEEMIKDSLARPWFSKFKQEQKRKPTIIIGEILNKSDEHIKPEIMAKEFRRALINSGEVDFVANKSEREEIREERSDQHSGQTRKDTVAAMGQEIGADYMLKGTIHNTRDEFKSDQSAFWQIDFELIDLSSNKIVWQGEKKIKKLINRDAIRW